MEPPSKRSRTADGNSPPSLKSLAQSRLLDTLEPNERTSLVSEILSGLPLADLTVSDLTAIPLDIGQAIVNAHASAEQTSTLLHDFPELQGRLKVVSHESSSLYSQAGEMYGQTTSVKTTYEIRPAANDAPYTLSVTLMSGYFSGENTSTWSKLKMVTSGGRIKAGVEYSSMDKDCGGRTTFQTRGLSALFTALAADLQLSIKAPLVEGDGDSDEESEWDLPELETPDLVQRDKVFGRLIQIFIPEELRETYLDRGLPQEYIEISGKEKDDSIENVVRGAAVAGFNIDHEDEEY
ncbi:hypothetical protein RQP46_001287 [Phenoliferia psychrophenolica]